jgi:hypothetical protein
LQNQEETCETIKAKKAKKQRTEFARYLPDVHHSATSTCSVEIEPLILHGICDIWKIDPFMLHGICRILKMICAAFLNFNLAFLHGDFPCCVIIEAL